MCAYMLNKILISNHVKHINPSLREKNVNEYERGDDDDENFYGVLLIFYSHLRSI